MVIHLLHKFCVIKDNSGELYTRRSRYDKAANRRRKQADSTDHPWLKESVLEESAVSGPSLSSKKLKLLHGQEYCASLHVRV